MKTKTFEEYQLNEKLSSKEIAKAYKNEIKDYFYPGKDGIKNSTEKVMDAFLPSLFKVVQKTDHWDEEWGEVQQHNGGPDYGATLNDIFAFLDKKQLDKIYKTFTK